MTRLNPDHYGPIALALFCFAVFVLCYVGAPALWLWVLGG